MNGQGNIKEKNVMKTCLSFRSLLQQLIIRLKLPLLAFFSIDGEFIFHKEFDNKDGYSSAIIDVLLQLLAKKEVALTYDVGRDTKSTPSPWNDDRTLGQYVNEGFERNQWSKNINYHTNKANQIDRLKTKKDLQEISMRRQVWNGMYYFFQLNTEFECILFLPSYTDTCLILFFLNHILHILDTFRVASLFGYQIKRRID